MPDPTAGGSPAIRTTDPLSLWPALPSDGAIALIAQLYQLERSEWLPAEAIAERQLAQLGALMAHAWRTFDHLLLTALLLCGRARDAHSLFIKISFQTR